MTTAGAASGRTGTGSGRPARWLARRTLRGRLIAGLLALLAVACAAVGAVTYVSLHSYLLGQLDQQLVEASGRYQACLGNPPPGDSDRDSHPGPPHGTPYQCAQQQQEQTFSAQVRQGLLTDNYVSYGTCTLSHADKAVLTAYPAAGQPFTSDLSSLGDYRLLAVHNESTPGVTYLTGLPMTQVNSTLRQVAEVEIMVFAAALVLTGVLGTGFVRLSLRPLRRVAATATKVAERPLASGEVTLPERVPDADPRTEVGQVGSAFNRMLGHVEAALARRAASEARLRRFAADASHELRTPLSAIRGYAELARRHPGPVPDDIAHALGRVESESARMSVLVDELLLLAQLDAGRPLAKEPVDLTRLAIDATSDARAASQDHRWVLELPDEPVHVEGDEHRLHQVLANLMSNAAKHTPRGTTVTVSLTTNEDPPTVRVSVTDSGPGIPEELQPALFERFVRGDSARSNAGTSTGLGLAIVQAVTTAHGGSVSVTSRPGHTSFVITLPRLTSVPASA
ncbi:MAG TPA: HAMP domain-containing sensor histidine kinase [Streptosporangiaceae bacterium]|nr:HAMP domain-containing sensor histidine kinase [Streptosporangiaceae bacterium]